MTGYIITAIIVLSAAWLISKTPCCKGKCGTLDVSKLLDTGDRPVERRKQKIGNIVFHIKSVFTGQRELDDAIKSIVIRKMGSASLTRGNNAE